MRISPVLLLLPVLVLTGSATIANDDRPASPQPAIVPSAVPEKLTIESLTGTYKGIVDGQELTNFLRAPKKQNLNIDEATLREIEISVRKTFDEARITINADGTFESSFAAEKQRGTVRIDGNKLTFTNDPIEPINGAGSSIKAPQCAKPCTFTLSVSTDRKTLLPNNAENPSRLIPTYIKQ